MHALRFGQALHLPENPSSPAEWDAVRDIFREYAEVTVLILCFQDFESELAQLPGDYAEPRGALLIAEVEGAWQAVVPCVRWTTPTTPTPAK